MKKILFAVLLACLVMNGHAQESEKYKKAKAKIKTQEGYVIDSLGNTITGLIVDSDGKPAGRVSIMVPTGETLKYAPKEAKEYGFAFYRFISTGEQFLQVLFENKKVGIYKDIETIRHYTDANGTTTSFSNRTPVYSSQPSGGLPGVTTQEIERLYIHRPGEADYKKVTKIIFAKSMSEYFVDCSTLSQKIKNKEYRAREEDLREIASFYDRECTQQ